MKEKIALIKISILFCYKNIIKYSKWWGGLLIVIAIISSISVLFHAQVLEQMISILTNGEKAGSVYWGIALWAVSVIAMNLFSLLNKYVNIHINAEMERGFLPIIIDKYNKIEYSAYESQETQNIFQHVNSSSYSDIVSMFNVSIGTLVSIITIVEVVYIFTQAVWWIGIVTIALTVPLTYFNIKAAYIEMKQRWTMTKDIRKRYYFQSLFADKNTLQEIKVFDSKDYFIDESEKLTHTINTKLKANIGKVALLRLIFAFIVCTFTVLVIGISSGMMIDHQLQLGTYVILISSISTFVSAEQKLSNSISSVVRISEKVRLILNFF